MKFEKVFGKDVAGDAEIIDKALDSDKESRFLFDGNYRLNDYIDELAKHLPPEKIFILKICNNSKKIRITLLSEDINLPIKSFEALLQSIEIDKKYEIIIDNNNHGDYAFVIQQLIYLQYPLKNIRIIFKDKIEAENKDIDAIDFQSLLDKVSKQTNSKLKTIKKNIKEIDDNLYKKINNSLDIFFDSIKSIEATAKKNMDSRIHLAVLASKKTGKSSLVNCMLGQQLLVSDNEIATPNNCILSKSIDKKYHITINNKLNDFDNENDVCFFMDEKFREAQNDKKNKFTCADMDIKYVANSNSVFTDCVIYDTPGPDASGTEHKNAAEDTLEKCDAAIFLIDYSKYLTDSEEKYLRQVESIFEKKHKFHTLVFAVNKIDARFTDSKTEKSVIKSLAFIKRRLYDIDNIVYGNCILFPTCALEYLSSLIVEKANIDELSNGSKITTEELKKITFSNKNIGQIKTLKGFSEILEYYSEVKKFNLNTFKEDSGVIQLFDYVSGLLAQNGKKEKLAVAYNTINNEVKKINDSFNFIKTDEQNYKKLKKQFDKLKEGYERFKKYHEIISTSGYSYEEKQQLHPDSLANQDKKEIKEKLERCLDFLSSEDIEKILYEKMISKCLEKLRNWIWVKKKLNGYDIKNLFDKDCLVSIIQDYENEKRSRIVSSMQEVLSELLEQLKTLFFNRKKYLEQLVIFCESNCLDTSQIPCDGLIVKCEINNADNILTRINLSNKFDMDFFHTLNDLYSRGFWGGFIGKFTDNYDHELELEKEVINNYNRFREVFDKNIQKNFKNYVWLESLKSKVEDDLRISLVFGFANNHLDKIYKANSNAVKELETSYNKLLRVLGENIEQKGKELDKYQEYLNKCREVKTIADSFSVAWAKTVVRCVSIKSKKEIASSKKTINNMSDEVLPYEADEKKESWIKVNGKFIWSSIEIIILIILIWILCCLVFDSF